MRKVSRAATARGGGEQRDGYERWGLPLCRHATVGGRLFCPASVGDVRERVIIPHRRSAKRESALFSPPRDEELPFFAKGKRVQLPVGGCSAVFSPQRYDDGVTPDGRRSQRQGTACSGKVCCRGQSVSPTVPQSHEERGEEAVRRGLSSHEGRRKKEARSPLDSPLYVFICLDGLDRPFKIERTPCETGTEGGEDEVVAFLELVKVLPHQDWDGD